MDEAFEWDGDWVGIADTEVQRRLGQEFQREAPAGHVLHGIGIVAVGRRLASDDVLFRLPDGQFAQVHLTWSVETAPDWPHTLIYSSFIAWKAVPPEER